MLNTSEARYALGLESEHTFLEKALGCQVDAADVLTRRHLRGGVALWYLAPTADFPRANRFAPIHVAETNPNDVRTQLRRQGVAFALTQSMPLADLSTYPPVQRVLSRSRPIWHGGACTLYRLDLRPRS